MDILIPTIELGQLQSIKTFVAQDFPSLDWFPDRSTISSYYITFRVASAILFNRENEYKHTAHMIHVRNSLIRDATSKDFTCYSHTGHRTLESQTLDTLFSSPEFYGPLDAEMSGYCFQTSCLVNDFTDIQPNCADVDGLLTDLYDDPSYELSYNEDSNTYSFNRPRVTVSTFSFPSRVFSEFDSSVMYHLAYKRYAMTEYTRPLLPGMNFRDSASTSKFSINRVILYELFDNRDITFKLYYELIDVLKKCHGPTRYIEILQNTDPSITIRELLSLPTHYSISVYCFDLVKRQLPVLD
jgi:hypothetical protein